MAEPPEPSLATVTSRCTLLKSPTKSTRMSKGSCPIMGLEFNGKYKFFALQNCGHVVSAKALKEVKLSACLVCHKEFVESYKVVINGSEAEGKKKRGMDVLDGEKGFKGLSNGEMKKFRAVDAAQARATKEVYALIFTSSKKSDFKETFTCRIADHSHSVETDDRLTPLNLGFGPQTWRKRAMGVGDREKGFKGLNNGGMKKFRAADMVPANATKEVYSSIFYYLEEVGF
ncbi:hypothetical protein CXB51_018809 [Gossypium anomalum]|uniref:Replication termination factor 2 n=1 Tax=Gossypium anomalum TaxID=47600 RepID=A0A8J5YLD7_9ROSI|nr:hypothetical protein CXB51_018809 [Gossypium anomalum]